MMRDTTAFSNYGDCGQLTIDLTALADNYRAMVAHAGKAETASVVKADAYGLGCDKVAPALAEAGCKSFFVAQCAEGLALRALLPHVDIYVLNGLATHPPHIYSDNNLVPCLISLAQMAQWKASGHHPAALMLDIGFNRLGLDDVALTDLTQDMSLFEGWQLKLILGHLACSDDDTHPMNRAQLEQFHSALAALPPAPASLANSGGVFLGSDYHFDMVRVGVSLYGGLAAESLRPVAHLHAPLLQIRTLAQGDTIGYDASFTAPHAMVVGIVALGYGDGIPHHFATQNNVVHFWVGDMPAPLVGRISMDTLAIDLTQHSVLPDIGAQVEVFGAHNPITQLAREGGTIPYELLTRLGSRHKRLYE